MRRARLHPAGIRSVQVSPRRDSHSRRSGQAKARRGCGSGLRQGARQHLEAARETHERQRRGRLRHRTSRPPVGGREFADRPQRALGRCAGDAPCAPRWLGADGAGAASGRLARQARFEGDIEAEHEYLMVDDFVGQGGTLANLRGWIEKQGGIVIGAVGLTGKRYSAKLNPSEEQLHELRKKHGPDLEKWWRDHFGHPFNCLTQSEARYLARSPDADTIRDRLAATECQGNRPSDTRRL